MRWRGKTVGQAPPYRPILGALCGPRTFFWIIGFLRVLGDLCG